MDLSTNTNVRAKDFARHLNRLKGCPQYKDSHYIRLQPELETEISLAEYLTMEELESLTEDWMNGTDRDRQDYINRKREATSIPAEPRRPAMTFSQLQQLVLTPPKDVTGMASIPASAPALVQIDRLATPDRGI